MADPDDTLARLAEESLARALALRPLLDELLHEPEPGEDSDPPYPWEDDPRVLTTYGNRGL